MEIKKGTVAFIFCLVLSLISIAHSETSKQQTGDPAVGKIYQIQGVNNLLKDIAFVPYSELAFAVGTNIILKSTDDGGTWSTVYGGGDSLEYDQYNGDVVDIRSNDEQQPVFTTVYIDNQSQRILVAGGIYVHNKSLWKNMVLSSHDAGATWKELLLAYSPDTGQRTGYPFFYLPGIINDITVDEHGTIWAVDNGVLLHSSDDGHTWNYYFFPDRGADITALCTSVAFYGDRGWVTAARENRTEPPGGIHGIFYGTTDGGASWEEANPLVVNENDYYSGEFLIHHKIITGTLGRGNIGWLVGGIMLGSPPERGYGLLQLSPAYTWKAYEFTDNEHDYSFFIDIDMNEKGQGCCISPEGTFYITGDWGNTWGRKYSFGEEIDNDMLFQAVAVSQTGIGVLVGTGGRYALVNTNASISNERCQRLPATYKRLGSVKQEVLVNGRIVNGRKKPLQCTIQKQNKGVHQKHLSLY